MSAGKRPLAVVFGCAGLELTNDERSFYAAAQPLGFILFQRNCDNPAQVTALIEDLQSCIPNRTAPILIDQEGGRVQRLKPPNWRQAFSAGAIGAVADLDKAVRAAWLNARLIAAELAPLGFNFNCAPCLDLHRPDTHQAIGDRAYSDAADRVIRLGRAVADGLLAGGILPVIKHMPGHGRATVDSHFDLPHVDCDWQTLVETDMAPFRALADLPFGMSAHLLYRAIDDSRPGTLSPTVIKRAIRGEIGFRGVLFTDDLSMQALGGTIEARAAAALAAGCDVALHCNGVLAEMEAIAQAIPVVDESVLAAVSDALERLSPPLTEMDWHAELDDIMAA